MSDSSTGSDKLIYVALTAAAFCVPCAIPLAVTLAGWAVGAPLRLGIGGALIATFVIFAVWFIVAEIVDLLLRRLGIGKKLLGRIASNFVSGLVLALGYWLIVDSPLVALLMAAIVYVLFLCVAPIIEYWYEKEPASGS
jgi:hypothetical protein